MLMKIVLDWKDLIYHNMFLIDLSTIDWLVDWLID